MPSCHNAISDPVLRRPVIALFCHARIFFSILARKNFVYFLENL